MQNVVVSTPDVAEWARRTGSSDRRQGRGEAVRARSGAAWCESRGLSGGDRRPLRRQRRRQVDADEGDARGRPARLRLDLDRRSRGRHDVIRGAPDRRGEAGHQDLALPPDLTVLESMFLGHEVMRTGLLGRLGVLDRAAMADASREALERLGIRLTTVRIPVKSLSGGQRQAVAVARAVMWTSTALLMDEPTAALGARQSDIVCDTIVSTAARGLGVLVISHDLPRTLAIAHRVVVLVRGAVAFDGPAHGLSVPEIVEIMVGHLRESMGGNSNGGG